MISTPFFFFFFIPSGLALIHDLAPGPGLTGAATALDPAAVAVATAGTVKFSLRLNEN